MTTKNLGKEIEIIGLNRIGFYYKVEIAKTPAVRSGSQVFFCVNDTF